MSQAPGGEPFSPEMLALCDEGIRQTVADLNAAGFITTDSGDGVSKEAGEDVLPYAHVVIASSRASLALDADSVLAFLEQEGYGGGLHIEATYNPADESAVVIATWP